MKKVNEMDCPLTFETIEALSFEEMDAFSFEVFQGAEEGSMMASATASGLDFNIIKNPDGSYNVVSFNEITFEMNEWMVSTDGEFTQIL